MSIERIRAVYWVYEHINHWPFCREDFKYMVDQNEAQRMGYC